VETIKTIYDRRSIRRFRSDDIPKDILVSLLNASCQAPSAKNSQPWRFLVYEGKKREELIKLLMNTVNTKNDSSSYIDDCKATFSTMEQAPVILLVFNGESKRYNSTDPILPRVVDVQSIGACIQNLALAATSMGIGTLWICDILYAYDDIRQFADCDHELIAAVALGYPEKIPKPKSRKPLEAVVTWKR
jgi:nitroreductase